MDLETMTNEQLVNDYIAAANCGCNEAQKECFNIEQEAKLRGGSVLKDIEYLKEVL